MKPGLDIKVQLLLNDLRLVMTIKYQPPSQPQQPKIHSQIPVLRDLHFERRQVVLEINAGGSVTPFGVVDWPYMVLHAVLVR